MYQELIQLHLGQLLAFRHNLEAFCLSLAADIEDQRQIGENLQLQAYHTKRNLMSLLNLPK